MTHWKNWLNNTWSDAAREASAAARRGHDSKSGEPIDKMDKEGPGWSAEAWVASAHANNPQGHKAADKAHSKAAAHYNKMTEKYQRARKPEEAKKSASRENQHIQQSERHMNRWFK